MKENCARPARRNAPGVRLDGPQPATIFTANLPPLPAAPSRSRLLPTPRFLRLASSTPLLPPNQRPHTAGSAPTRAFTSPQHRTATAYRADELPTVGARSAGPFGRPPLAPPMDNSAASRYRVGIPPFNPPHRMHLRCTKAPKSRAELFISSRLRCLRFVDKKTGRKA